MAQTFSADSGAALLFLIGYVALFVWTLWHYIVGAFKLRSRWTLLLFHVVIRIASQACGIAFTLLGFENIGVFLAFLILGAEGYFTLVLCAFRFLISWHRHNLPSHVSWLEPPPKHQYSESLKAWISFFALICPAITYYNPMAWFHSLLVYANTIIVAGGSFLSNSDDEDRSEEERNRLFNLAKIFRTTGQSIFLACNTFLLLAILYTIWQDKRKVHSRGKGAIHPTLIILFSAWFPLTIRGVWGVLQAASWTFSYVNLDNYTSHGFTPRFSALENILGVLTEWLACVLLSATYYPSRADPPKIPERGQEPERLPLSTVRTNPDA